MRNARSGSGVGDDSTVRALSVLIVDDDELVAATLRDCLATAGYESDVSLSGAEALASLDERSFDAILLDVVLPDIDGLEICRTLRRRGVTIPVLMLTGLASPNDAIAGLDAGADGYVTKPFDVGELLARLRAILRRGPATVSALRCSSLELNLYRHLARRDGRDIPLSTREFELLEHLMRHQGKVVTRDDLAEHVWQRSLIDASNVIDVTIAALRRKVDRDFALPLIETIVGRGYRLADPLDRA